MTPSIPMILNPQAPHQSMASHVSFPGITIAATELGVTRSHLWQVLSGKRDSKPLMARWNAWLAAHPQFSRLQPPTESIPPVAANVRISGAITLAVTMPPQFGAHNTLL